MSRRFEKVLRQNKLPKIRFHDLRHTAGSIPVNGGHTIKQVQAFLGHEDVLTTPGIYTHVPNGDSLETSKAMRGFSESVSACSANCSANAKTAYSNVTGITEFQQKRYLFSHPRRGRRLDGPKLRFCRIAPYFAPQNAIFRENGRGVEGAAPYGSH